MKGEKKIHVWNFAKVQAVMFGLIGVVCGILYSFGGLLIDSLVSMGVLSSETTSTSGLGMGTLLAFGALAGMPVIFAASGWILGLAQAVLFNVFSRWTPLVQTDLGAK